MAVEDPNGTICGLDPSAPNGLDPVSRGDDHFRMLKLCLQEQFPGALGTGFCKTIIATEDEINTLVGSNTSTTIQEQINAIISGGGGMPLVPGAVEDNIAIFDDVGGVTDSGAKIADFMPLVVPAVLDNIPLLNDNGTLYDSGDNLLNYAKLAGAIFTGGVEVPDGVSGNDAANINNLANLFDSTVGGSQGSITLGDITIKWGETGYVDTAPEGSKLITYAAPFTTTAYVIVNTGSADARTGDFLGNNKETVFTINVNLSVNSSPGKYWVAIGD